MPKKAKNEKIMTSLYIEKELRDELAKIEEEEERSFGYLVNKALREWLESRRKR